MPAQPLVTLLTDFGTRDAYVATMKGVLLRRAQGAQIVDLSHDVPPHDVLAASFLLAQAVPYFPPETVHVVVVDPGVGTERQVLVGRFGGQIVVFPDNGVATFLVRRAPLEGLHAVQQQNLLPGPGPHMTFHGRDVFAPVAAELLNGTPPAALGPTPERYRVLDLPEPEMEDKRIVGSVIYVDRFGNLISNILGEDVQKRWQDFRNVSVRCGEHAIGHVQATYGQVKTGQALALINSSGLLEVAMNQARADESLAVGVGTEVLVEPVVLAADRRGE